MARQQAVLPKIFTGGLVTHDSSDELAATCLGYLRAERDATPGTDQISEIPKLILS